MPTLIFRGSQGEQRVELESELSVGRDPGNDVVLSEQGVSRRHCRFFVDEGGQVWVEDVGSANGVRVAGERIGEAVEVTDGVEVVVGGCKVKLAPRRPTSAARRPAASGSGSRKAAPRSTALARPGGTGKGTRMMAAVESPPRRARPAPRPGPTGGGDGRPRLTGMAGPFAGLAFEFDKPKLLVGRVPPADVLLDDDSVSRRHAEVMKIGSRFSVRDLGSANGTFLNGDRVSEAPLTPGDVVRFGVVELAFSGPGKGKAAAGLDPEKKKKLMILGGAGGGVLLLVVLLAALAGGGGAAGGAGAGSVGPVEPQEEEIDLNRMMGKCEALADPENETYNCEQAVKLCTDVFDHDPTFGKAKQNAKRCKRELEFEEILKDVQTKIITTQEEEALKLLGKIEKDSATFPRAMRKFNEVLEILYKRNKSACKGDVAAGRFEMALPACQRTLELTCNRPEGPDGEAMGWFKNASRQSGRGKGEFQCPPDYAKYQYGGGRSDENPQQKAEDQIRAKYSFDGLVARSMIGYCNVGRPKQTADALKRMRSRNPKMRGQLNEIIQYLEIIEGRVATGQEFMRLNKPKECHAVWQDAFDADAHLMPPGVICALRKDLGQQLAKAYYLLARDALMKEHYDKAFENVYEGYKLDKNNLDLARAMAFMERDGNRRLEEDASCDTVAYVISTTAPESTTRKRAKELGAKLNCD